MKIFLFIVCFLSFNCVEQKPVYFPKIPNIGDVFVERYIDNNFSLRESNEKFMKFRAVSDSYVKEISSGNSYRFHTFVYVTINIKTNKVLSVYSKETYAGEWD